MPSDQISILGLDLPVQIGVPDSEREGWQNLRANVWMDLNRSFDDLGDDLGNTIDYQSVSEALKTLASSRPRRLIETLASEMAGLILTQFPASQVTIELQKRVLPGVDHVAVRLTRRQPHP